MLAPLGQAIDALGAEVTGLLSVPDPALAPQVTVLATKAGLAGLGGFVGLHDDPVAEVHARLLTAEVAVRVFANDVATLAGAEARAARDIVAADPVLLRQRGILTIARLTDRDPPTLAAADGIAAPFGRDLRFSIRYEHRPLPAAAEGVLGAVPSDVTMAALTGRGRLLYASDFATSPMADFTAADGAGGTGSAGAWSYDAVTREVVQTGTLGGGGNGIAGTKTGTYLVMNPAVAGDVGSFVLRAEMMNGATGGVGLVFRFRDTATFGFVLLEQPANATMIGKRVADAGSLLADGGRLPGRSYSADVPIRLRLVADGDRFELALDEVTVLAGRDPALTAPGRVGFFCRRAGTARFRNIRLTSL